jgi:pimeloyl-ACP methyl ester carboxylesterase
VCTYGFYEKQDLGRVLDRVAVTPIVLMGTSLGAAVALQAAAQDRRIGAVVAVSSYSDLRTAASERAPFFASKGNIAEAFKLAEAEGKFRADDVSPMAAAAYITAPTLIVHGDHDDETPPARAKDLRCPARAEAPDHGSERRSQPRPHGRRVARGRRLDRHGAGAARAVGSATWRATRGVATAGAFAFV